MNDVTRYADMKDSGVEWIGKIPSHWETSTIGALYELRSEKVSDKDYPPLSVTQKGILHQLESVAKTDDGDNRKLVCKNDFVINSRSDRRGSCGISSYTGSVSLINIVLNPKNKMNPNYYNWLFHSEMFSDEFYKWGRGIVDDLWTTRWSEMKKINIPVPPLSMQSDIASYLDDQCAKIDDIIAGARTSIDEYRKWKASVIYEAVTKGLDPHAEMKDSGVEWIGKIPKHWKVVPLKRLCSVITDGSHFSPETVDNGYPYITATDVRGLGIDYTSTKYISEKDFFMLQKQGCQPLKGDVLIVKDGATTGRVGVMIDDTKCVALSSVAFLRPNKNITTDYLRWILESEIIQFQIRKSMAGSAMPRTTLTKLVNYLGILCPLLEQQKISSYINYKCSEIDQLISEKEALIADLESYKKSLIYEVVTGKRKVS